MDEIEQMNNNFNEKKPKKKGLLICIIAVAVIIAALVLVYLFVFSSPKRIINSQIDKFFEEEKDAKYDTLKANISLKVSGNIKNSEMQEVQEILNEIQKCTLNMDLQLDQKNSKEIIGLGLDYNNDKVIELTEYYNNGDVYLYLNEIFDKYIKVELEEEQKIQIKEALENVGKADFAKISETVKKELKSELSKNGEYKKEKEEITIAGKKQKLTKSTVTLNQKQFMDMISKIISKLKEDEDFMDVYGQGVLLGLEEGLNDVSSNKENKINLSIYTKGILNKYKGMSISIYVAEDKSTMTLRFMKVDKDSYEYSVSMKSSGISVQLVKGEIEIKEKNKNEGNIKITADIQQLGNIELQIGYNVKYNERIDNINITNSVNLEDLTEEDLEKIMEKLQEKPLISELLEEAGSNTLINTDDQIITPSISTSETVTTSDNQVSGYGYLVEYSVPINATYKKDYSADIYKLYSVGNDIDATTMIRYLSSKGYEEEIKSDYEFYKDGGYYKNINLDTVKTLTVGDKTFNYQKLSYESNSEYYSSKYEKVYVWYELGDSQCFTIEFSSSDGSISEEAIKGFLNIKVDKNS